MERMEKGGEGRMQKVVFEKNPTTKGKGKKKTTRRATRERANNATATKEKGNTRLEQKK